MITKAQRIRLGVFVVVSLVLLMTLLVAVLGSSIWSERDHYLIRYGDSVSGLEVGAPVKVNGVRMGRVEDIDIDEDNLSLTVVTISLNQGTPVKANTRADMNIQGITGLKFIELIGGTSAEDTLRPGSEIKAGRTVSMMDEVTGQLEKISPKLETLLDQLLQLTSADNRALVSDALQSTGSLAANLDRTVAASSDDIARLIKNLANASGKLNGTLDELKRTAEEARVSMVSVRRASEDMLKEARGTFADARKQVADLQLGGLSGKVGKLLDDTNAVVQRVDMLFGRSREDIRRSLQLMSETSANLRDFSRLIREDPSLLLGSRKREERSLP